MKILAAHQLNLLPYLGVWEKVFVADEFVWLDDVQFSKGDYTNRVQMLSNRLLMEPRWLTLPLKKPKLGTLIRDVELAENWREELEGKLAGWYPEMNVLSAMLCNAQTKYLMWVNWVGMCSVLLWFKEFKLTKTHLSSTVMAGQQLKAVNSQASFALFAGTSSQRLLDLCKQYNCDTYLSGAGAKSYLDVALFQSSGVQVVWQDFKQVPYKQKDPHKFHPGLSVIDYMVSGEGPEPLIERCKDVYCEILAGAKARRSA